MFLTVGKRLDQNLLIHGKVFRRRQEGQQLGNPCRVLGFGAYLLAQKGCYNKGTDSAGGNGVLQVRIQCKWLDEQLKLIELFAGHF